MNKIVILLCLFCSLVFSKQGISQTIHKSEIKKFVAYAPLLSEKPGQVPEQFYYCGLVRDTTKEKEFYEWSKTNGGKRPIILGMPDWLDTEKTTLEIPEKNLLLVILYDLNGFERQDNVLTFWKIKGDSLTFKFLYNKTLVTGIGTVLFKEIAFFEDSSMLIILNGKGGDAGEWWGDFRFLQYKEPDTIREIYKKGYGCRDTDFPYTGLDYTLIKNKKKQLIVKLIEKHYQFLHDKSGVFKERLIGTDNLFVNLSQILANHIKAKIPLENLIKDTKKHETLKFCSYYKGYADSASMSFYNNGLMVLDSKIFSTDKEKSYFRWQFNPDSTEVTFGFIDPKVNFDPFANNAEEGWDGMEEM